MSFDVESDQQPSLNSEIRCNIRIILYYNTFRHIKPNFSHAQLMFMCRGKNNLLNHLVSSVYHLTVPLILLSLFIHEMGYVSKNPTLLSYSEPE